MLFKKGLVFICILYIDVIKLFYLLVVCLVRERLNE